MQEKLRFYVQAGRRVVLEYDEDIPLSEVEAFLVSVVAGVILHQRGVLALHASAVVYGGKAIALTGASGRGKSTLAAALAADGWPLLTDDICRIDFTDKGPMAMPGLSSLRLWPDALRTLGRAPEDLASVRPGHPKKILVEPNEDVQPTPLGAIIRLVADPLLDKPFIERLTGPTSIFPADNLVYRVRLGRHLGRRLGLFDDLTRLANSVPIYQLVRSEGPPDLPALIRLVKSVLEPV